MSSKIDHPPRRWLVRLGRAAVSAGVLAALFAVLPIESVASTIRRIDAVRWGGTLLIFVSGHVVTAMKWRLLIGPEAGFVASLRAHFAGLAANLWLPGMATGDVVRTAMLYARVSDKARLAVGSVADRLVDTLGLVLLAAAGLALTFRRVPSGGALLAGVAIAVAGLVAATLALPLLLRILVDRLPAGRLQRLVEQARAGIGLLARQPGRLAGCLVLSMAVQAAFIGANLVLAEAAGVDAPVAAWFFAWPLSKIIATLPISLGGLGVREASLAGFLAPFGAAPAAVVATGLVWQSVLLATGVLGAAVLALTGRGILPTRWSRRQPPFEKS